MREISIVVADVEFDVVHIGSRLSKLHLCDVFESTFSYVVLSILLLLCLLVSIPLGICVILIVHRLWTKATLKRKK